MIFYRGGAEDNWGNTYGNGAREGREDTIPRFAKNNYFGFIWCIKINVTNQNNGY